MNSKILKEARRLMAKAGHAAMKKKTTAAQRRKWSMKGARSRWKNHKKK